MIEDTYKWIHIRKSLKKNDYLSLVSLNDLDAEKIKEDMGISMYFSIYYSQVLQEMNYTWVLDNLDMFIRRPYFRRLSRRESKYMLSSSIDDRGDWLYSKNRRRVLLGRGDYKSIVHGDNEYIVNDYILYLSKHRKEYYIDFSRTVIYHNQRYSAGLIYYHHCFRIDREHIRRLIDFPKWLGGVE